MDHSVTSDHLWFPVEHEEAAALLETHPHYRVLRAMPALDHLPLAPSDGPLSKAVLIDVETTGLVVGEHRIIELAALPIWYDELGRIVRVGEMNVWLEGPGHPLTPEIVRLTGITDAELAGKMLDDAAIEQLLGDASLLIGHNAAFDSRFCEARLPRLAGMPWACSLREIDWQTAGHAGSKLGELLAQVCGLFHSGHRAAADVEALAWLLASSVDGGRTALSELVATSQRTTAMIEARGAPFAVKDMLKARGYRWRAERRVWWKEIDPTALPAEREWLASAAACPQPMVTMLTAADRHR